MAKRNDLVGAVEAIHAAGLDSKRWPQALKAVAQAVGGNAGSLEVVDLNAVRHLEMHSYGLPGAEDIAFREDFHEINVRFNVVSRQKLHDLSWDYMILDEAAMQRAPFYTEVMPRFDIRYFVGGIVLKTAREFATVGVHRSPRIGHIQADGIAAMRLLTPHVSQAYEVNRRLGAAEAVRDALEQILDQIEDGAALVRADGTVVHANEALLAVARRNDGLAIRNGNFEIADAAARQLFGQALAAILRLRVGELAPAPSDVQVPRRDSASPYVLAVRPLVGEQRELAPSAAAVVFVREPTHNRKAAVHLLQERFGLTNAEAALAQALQSGVMPADYARSHALSLNTVYTHLRRVREKTGSGRMGELIHKLNELSLPLRLD